MRLVDAAIVAGLWFAAVAQSAEETSVLLPSGHRLTLAGKWTKRADLWPDAAIVLPENGIAVLESGNPEPRDVYHEPWRGRDGNTLGIVFSRDSSRCFAWLDNNVQFVAIDVATGEFERLLSLPTRVWHYEGMQECDPEPVYRPEIVVERGAYLLLLVQEDGNDEVWPLQRRPDRRGGHQLLSVPSRGNSKPRLAPAAQWPGRAYDWVFSHQRGELYLVVAESRDGHARLRARQLDGTLVDRLGHEVRLWRSSLRLSPDEHWLLVEHGVKVEERRPEPEPIAPVRRLARDEVAAPLVAARASCVLIDLESGEGIELADGAHECTWSPDSKSVTYLRDWDLWRLDVATLARERLAWREPSVPGATPNYWVEPTWSPDGARLLVNVGGTSQRDRGEDYDYSLLLDFPHREYVVVPSYLSGAVWSPVARPFKKPD